MFSKFKFVVIKNKVCDKWLNLCGAVAQAHLGFIILIKQLSLLQSYAAIIINHERIHCAQQVELLVIFFYLIYVGHYLINLIKYRNHQEAYRNIIFEKESYNYERDFEYLKNRKLFAYWRK